MSEIYHLVEALEQKVASLESAQLALQQTHRSAIELAHAERAQAIIALTDVTRLKDEFMANVNHELRTPLNAILGMSESLQEGVYGPLNDRQLRSIEIISYSGHRLLTVINDILAISQLTADQLELNISTVAVSQICNAILSGIREQALQKSIQLTTNIAADLATIAVDEQRIQQVLINLLENAIKFTAERGRITFDVYVETVANEQPGWIYFSIADTGIGIATAHLPQLFQPFVQVDGSLSRPYEGTGLGLALVKQIVELHGGAVSVTSELGQGSCFAFKLPIINNSDT
jgi:signal transduction histidine kinase